MPNRRYNKGPSLPLHPIFGTCGLCSTGWYSAGGVATKCEQCGSNQYLHTGTLSDCITCSTGKEPDLSNCQTKQGKQGNKTKTKTRRQLQAGADRRVAAAVLSGGVRVWAMGIVIVSLILHETEKI